MKRTSEMRLIKVKNSSFNVLQRGVPEYYVVFQHRATLFCALGGGSS